MIRGKTFRLGPLQYHNFYLQEIWLRPYISIYIPCTLERNVWLEVGYENWADIFKWFHGLQQLLLSNLGTWLLETQMLGGLQHALPLKHVSSKRVDIFNSGHCQSVDRYRGKSFIEDVRKMLSTTGGARSTQLNVVVEKGS